MPRPLPYLLQWRELAAWRERIEIDANAESAAATEHGLGEDGADATEHDAGAATERVDASTLPLDLPAEFLIGKTEDDAHDPVDLMIVFQKNLEFVQEAGKRIYNLEQRRLQAT